MQRIFALAVWLIAFPTLAAAPVAPSQKLAQQKKIQMGVVALLMKSCVDKKVGAEASQAFLNDVSARGKTVEALCKEGEASAARAEVLAILKEKERDPVRNAALACFAQQRANVAMLAPAIPAADLANYERWVKSPATASREMKNSDICK
jgi:hypothetical protein